MGPAQGGPGPCSLDGCPPPSSTCTCAGRTWTPTATSTTSRSSGLLEQARVHAFWDDADPVLPPLTSASDVWVLVADVQVKYRDVIDHRTEPIQAEVSVVKCAGASFVIAYRLLVDGRECVTATTTMALVDGATGGRCASARTFASACSPSPDGTRGQGPTRPGAKGRHRRVRHALLSSHADSVPHRRCPRGLPPSTR